MVILKFQKLRYSGACTSSLVCLYLDLKTNVVKQYCRKREFYLCKSQSLVEFNHEHTLRKILEQAMTKMGFSARAYDRILKVTRISDDLAEHENIYILRFADSIEYRNLDRRVQV